MTSETIISVENLSKRYLIGHQIAQRERYTALRDVMMRETRNFGRKAVDFFRGRQVVQGDKTEEFWALRDVNFSVQRGEVLGIIGRNGAGKSTLLKILSRITEPSMGRVRLTGRVGSLLEVGTGFHPELTGRENIYLNGAILGMSRSEIQRKFDEIVAFAEAERFLDTPVKRYSSGMQVRLAFAVAAHLEPEILVIDEVLAVGDIEFQKRCIRKIGDVVSDGRTVLIVSHNLETVVSLCNRAIVLDAGTIACDATPDVAISSYLKHNDGGKGHVLFEHPMAGSGSDAEITRVELLDQRSNPRTSVATFDFLRFRLMVKCLRATPQGSVILEIRNTMGVLVLKIESHPSAFRPLNKNGDLCIDCCIEALSLLPGRYLLSVGLAIYGMSITAWYTNVATIVVVSPKDFQQSYGSNGVVAVPHYWEHGRTLSDSAPALVEGNETISG
jgi:lipopolysaccharide transport system ATP-binding protein